MKLPTLLPSLVVASLLLVAAPPSVLAQGGRGGGAGAAQATPPGPPAPVPAVVAIPRPSPADIDAARAALVKLAQTDAATGALLQKYPGLIEVRPPQPNTAIMPSLSQGFQAKHK